MDKVSDNYAERAREILLGYALHPLAYPGAIKDVARVLEQAALEARIEEAPNYICFHCGTREAYHNAFTSPPLQCPRPGSDDRYWQSRKDYFRARLAELRPEQEGKDAG